MSTVFGEVVGYIDFIFKSRLHVKCLCNGNRKVIPQVFLGTWICLANIH